MRSVAAAAAAPIELRYDRPGTDSVRSSRTISRVWRRPAAGRSASSVEYSGGYPVPRRTRCPEDTTSMLASLSPPGWSSSSVSTPSGTTFVVSDTVDPRRNVGG